MKPEFLRKVQQAGWHIEKVTEDAVQAKCPSAGCALRAMLAEGGFVPDCDPARSRDLVDRKVETYDDIRLMLRERRESLGLSIREVEEIGGMATDHLAKAEKDDPVKIPNANLLIEWAQSLGFELVLRPTDMTPYAIRTICDTRGVQERRSRRFDIEARRRGKVASVKR